jgi:hypothetical protein
MPNSYAENHPIHILQNIFSRKKDKEPAKALLALHIKKVLLERKDKNG